MVTASVISLLGIGIAASALLGIASRVFYVEEDPLVEAVMEALPGANCGGCGYAGCEGYAIAVAHDPSIPANLCVAGSEDTTAAVGKLTGKAAEASEPIVSFRRCVKTEGQVSYSYEYQGIPSCLAAHNLANGEDLCTWSCLGLGDCVKACPFDAILIRDGLAFIVPDKCVSCGKCIGACPRGVLELIPLYSRIMISCSTRNKGKVATESCQVGCINCKACIRKCPATAISSKDERIEIDQKVCLAYGPDCNEACVDACPRNILRPLDPVIKERKEKERAEAAAKKAAEAAAKKAAAAKAAEEAATTAEA